ncbi:MAG: hypothetical protein ACEPOW_13560, partial [Bacteroidales bacterium]
MKFLKNYYFFLVVVCFSLLSSQGINGQEKKKSYSGKPILKVFANYHSPLNGASDKSAMEVRRAYLGYKSKISEHYSAIVKLDIGSPNDESQYSLLKRYAYFKNAALVYKANNLTVMGGLIDLYQFKLQEKFWGHRYVEKSFMDLYKFGSSADIGISAKYKFSNIISADFTLMNGEGYKKLQSDNTYKAGLGITLQDFFFEGIVFRIYSDYEKKHLEQYTLASFVGYKHKKLFNIGFEYNYKGNSKFKNNYNLSGFSTYGKIAFLKKWEFFARYDYLYSNNKYNSDDEFIPWNLLKDGSKAIAGVQVQPVKGVKIALNYQDWFPYAKNMENKSFIYLDSLR